MEEILYILGGLLLIIFLVSLNLLVFGFLLKLALGVLGVKFSLLQCSIIVAIVEVVAGMFTKEK